jgi:hypothetical protein
MDDEDECEFGSNGEFSSGFPGVVQRRKNGKFHLAATDGDRGYLSFYLDGDELPKIFDPGVAKRLMLLEPKQGVTCYLRPVLSELLPQERESIAEFEPAEVVSLPTE